MMNFYFFVNILLQSVYLRFTMLFKDVTKGRRSVLVSFLSQLWNLLLKSSLIIDLGEKEFSHTVIFKSLREFYEKY